MWDGAAYQKERAKDLGRLRSSVLGICALFQKHFLRVPVISGWLRCLCCHCISSTMQPLCLLPSSGGLDPGIPDAQRKIHQLELPQAGGLRLLRAGGGCMKEPSKGLESQLRAQHLQSFFGGVGENPAAASLLAYSW